MTSPERFEDALTEFTASLADSSRSTLDSFGLRVPPPEPDPGLTDALRRMYGDQSPAVARTAQAMARRMPGYRREQQRLVLRAVEMAVAS